MTKFWIVSRRNAVVVVCASRLWLPMQYCSNTLWVQQPERLPSQQLVEPNRYVSVNCCNVWYTYIATCAIPAQ